MVAQRRASGKCQSAFRPRVDRSPPPRAEFDASEGSVGQLIEAYASILGELRQRGLVRTNNAPSGDLAEYACAIVYGGTLVLNSEKSYDLHACDGRRIQVNVRNMRSDTRQSAIFSVFRSIDFDACIFVLIDTDTQRVRAAFERSADYVATHGTHRAHTHGFAVRVSQARQLGIDLTDRVDEAWQERLAIGGPGTSI